VEFRCENGAEHAAVTGNANRLRATVGHIVQNALDVSKRDGVIRISLATSGAQALVEVSDDGPGMDPDFVRTELFKPFRSTKESGLGIGAYQCRDYARELGGDIEVVSSPGSGTTMRILLPLAVAADDRPRPLARA
jgi:signal transduction histidine kinase